jgi:hypothetical protein
VLRLIIFAGTAQYNSAETRNRGGVALTRGNVSLGNATREILSHADGVESKRAQ